MQPEHLGTGSLLRQWNINPLFKPREPSTQLDLRADGGTVLMKRQSRALQKLASLKALLTMQIRKLQRNRVRLHLWLPAAG